ncbi:CDP-glycerol glycerophosphotransferase family protein [Bacillus licheniformis]|nr:CDP-glycerol glycerophosphotransferase family protein [Bacillus licheniformis]
MNNEDLPGPVLYNVRELVEAIGNIHQVKSEFQTNYEKNKVKFTNHDDGNVTKE